MNFQSSFVTWISIDRYSRIRHSNNPAVFTKRRHVYGTLALFSLTVVSTFGNIAIIEWRDDTTVTFSYLLGFHFLLMFVCSIYYFLSIIILRQHRTNEAQHLSSANLTIIKLLAGYLLIAVIFKLAPIIFGFIYVLTVTPQKPAKRSRLCLGFYLSVFTSCIYQIANGIMFFQIKRKILQSALLKLKRKRRIHVEVDSL